MTQKIVLIAQRVIPDYRVPFFYLLSQSNDFDLNILYGDKKSSGSVFNSKRLEKIPAKKTKTYYFLNDFCIQPALLSRILLRKVDVIVAELGIRIISNLIAAVLAPMFSIKFIWWGSGFESLIDEKPFAYRVKRSMLKFLLNRADGVIAYSKYAGEYFSSLGCPPHKITIAPNSIDEKNLLTIREKYLDNPEKVHSLRDELRLLDKSVILFVGRLTKGKNLDILLDAFRILKRYQPNTALIIIGDGPLRDDLNRQSSDIEDCYLVGAIHGKEELATYFLNASIFVLPGLGGLAINEAMAYGLPIVCSQADGTEKQLVRENVNGVILKNISANLLAEKLLSLLKDDEMLKKMGNESLRIITEEINLKQMANKFQNAIYKNLGD